MSVQAVRTAIPVLDLGPFLAGVAGSLATTAERLRDALEHVGCFCIVNHGVSWPLVHEIFAEARRFHALPLDDKLALTMSKHDPDVINDVPLRGLNQWPANLPGFRDRLREYFATMEAFCTRLLPLYARALRLPDDFFAEPFRQAQISLRLSHYPRVPAEDDQFGLSPHTDAGFMTLLPDNDVPGLEIRPAGWEWVPAPHGDSLVWFMQRNYHGATEEARRP